MKTRQSRSKTCFKCDLEKPLNEFYAHPQMGDGHLGKCKACTRKDTKERADRLWENNPEWKAMEAARFRDKSLKARKEGKASPCKYEHLKAWRKRNHEKSLAHGKVAKAKAKGLLIPTPCEECGATERIQAHHEDYSKPLEVDWLCPACHGKRHRKY